MGCWLLLVETVHCDYNSIQKVRFFGHLVFVYICSVGSGLGVLHDHLGGVGEDLDGDKDSVEDNN